MVAVWAIGHGSEITEPTLGQACQSCILGKKAFPEKLRLKPSLVIQRTEPNFRAFKPLQQRLVFRAVKGASQKKLSFSFVANSAKASAMPSAVRPSWLKRSCCTTQWPCASRR